ncbi:MAG: hypothetical protein ACOX84_11825, partial [Methanothrix sp.]|uniref:hypothetical protein n=1 Tax=Methanothrix sp. TaxID=90426 RepID=UPI003D93EC06
SKIFDPFVFQTKGKISEVSHEILYTNDSIYSYRLKEVFRSPLENISSFGRDSLARLLKERIILFDISAVKLKYTDLTANEKRHKDEGGDIPGLPTESSAKPA